MIFVLCSFQTIFFMIVLCASSEMIKHVVRLLLANVATYFKVFNKKYSVISKSKLRSNTEYIEASLSLIFLLFHDNFENFLICLSKFSSLDKCIIQCDNSGCMYRCMYVCMYGCMSHFYVNTIT